MDGTIYFFFYFCFSDVLLFTTKVKKGSEINDVVGTD